MYVCGYKYMLRFSWKAISIVVFFLWHVFEQPKVHVYAVDKILVLFLVLFIVTDFAVVLVTLRTVDYSPLLAIRVFAVVC